MKRLARLFTVTSILLASLSLIAVGAFYLYAKRQGVPSSFWKDFKTAKVVFDENGIPTVSSSSWQSLLEAQGYVVASERMWQMDLMRRKTRGRLSEWFGEKTLELDLSRHRQDWPGVLEKAYQSLPNDEKQDCADYAKGVNRFIKDFEGRWGVEYTLLGVKPEPWSCVDSLSVVLMMSESLTKYIDREAMQHRWFSSLPEDWREFLFPMDHPWNHPELKGDRAVKEIALPIHPIKFSDEDKKFFSHPFKKLHEHVSIGSNSWAVRDEKSYFLANDPHLAYSVPMIWYAIRLKLSDKNWVVGASLPGVPGVVIGMNPDIAWSFTTTNEDVDDLVEEKIDHEKNLYLSSPSNWQPLKEKSFVVKVKDKNPVYGKARFTHRGPVVEIEDLPNRSFSRQWLALKPGILRLPIAKLNRASDWQSFNAALDEWKNPAQNVSYLDRKGNVGVRIIGTSVKRKASGRMIHLADKGEWLGFEPPSKRRRVYYPAGEKERVYLPTANQRMWPDKWGNHWDDDSRHNRLRSLLGENKPYSHQAMSRAQSDTYSRYSKLVLAWVSKGLPTNVKKYQDLVMRWQAWDGFAESDEKTYSEAILIDRWLTEICLERVREKFLPHEPEDLKYWHPLRRAWLIRVMQEEDGLSVFGLKNAKVAQSLADRVLSRTSRLPYPLANRFQKQHPFVEAIPVIGQFFSVTEYPQWGSYTTVRLERPKYGPSTRLIWDLKNPANSTWSFPVGQSGHFTSPYYSNMQRDFFQDKPLKVFGDGGQWVF